MRTHTQAPTARTIYHLVRKLRTRLSYGRPYSRFDSKTAANRVLKGELPRYPKALRERAIEAALSRPILDPLRRENLQNRLNAHLVRKYCAEADRRGLPDALDLGQRGWASLAVTDRTREAVLLHASGWKEYSSRVGTYPTSLSILAGQDDGGLWAVRVPGTITTVAEAIHWLKPSVVREAEAKGRQVLRQGDVWVVERKRGDAMTASDMPRNHTWDAATRTLYHGQHVSLHVPFPAIAVPQSTLAAIGTMRRRGD